MSIHAILYGEEMCPDCLTPIKRKKKSDNTIKIKKLYDYAKIPTRGSAYAAGYD